MDKSELAMVALCEAMLAEFGAGVEFDMSLGELVGRYRAEHDKRMRDAQAADLLHHGWREVSERFGVCRATAYNMAERGRKSKQALAG